MHPGPHTHKVTASCPYCAIITLPLSTVSVTVISSIFATTLPLPLFPVLLYEVNKFHIRVAWTNDCTFYHLEKISQLRYLYLLRKPGQQSN